MMFAKMIVVCLAALLPAFLLAGCVKVDARPPESISFGGEDFLSGPPPAQIPAAPAGNAADLQRENSQLRQRIDWLTDQNRKSDKKYRELGQEMEEIRLEMQKIAAERDRYQRALGD